MIPTNETKLPYLIISLVSTSWVAKAMALGGGLIGRIMAREQAKATPMAPTTGEIKLNDVTIGIRRFAAEVLPVIIRAVLKLLNIKSKPNNGFGNSILFTVY